MRNPISDLEQLCLIEGIALKQVLHRAGVAYSTWWRWKVGKNEPLQGTLRRLNAVVREISDEAA